MVEENRAVTPGGTPVGTNVAMVTIGTMRATLTQALDTTIANVALPYMAGPFPVSYEQVTWVLTSYIVAAAIMTLPTGWFAAGVAAVGSSWSRGHRTICPKSYAKRHFRSTLPLRPVLKEGFEMEIPRIRRLAALIA